MDKGRAAEKRVAKAAQPQRDALADKMIKPIVDALEAEDLPLRYNESEFQVSQAYFDNLRRPHGSGIDREGGKEIVSAPAATSSGGGSVDRDT